MKTLFFFNASNRVVGVTDIVSSSPEFTVVAPAIDVPPNGEAGVQVVVRPTLFGPRSARLDFKTTLRLQPAAIAQLKVFGGGPDIDAPTVLDFGPVA